jgi:transposase-like protein
MLRWGFWIGVGFAAVQVFQKLTQKPAWEMNAGRSKAEMEALKARALEMYVPGEPLRSLAEALGVDDSTIYLWLKEAGVYVPATKGRKVDEQLYQEALSRYVPGESVVPIAEDLGLGPLTIRRWMKKAGVYKPASTSRKLTEEQESLRHRVLEEYRPGINLSAFTRDIGVSRTTALQWLEKAGLYEPASQGKTRKHVPVEKKIVPATHKQLYREALRRYVPGEPVAQLAKELGVSYPTVLRWLKKAGVYEMPRKHLYQEAVCRHASGEPANVLAQEFGIPLSTVIHWLKKADIYDPIPRVERGRVLRDELLYKEALCRYVPGEPVTQLAEELGVSYPTFIKWMKDAGV